MNRLCAIVAAFIAVMASTAAPAQQTGQPGAPAGSPSDGKPPMSREELEQLVAPIALYPDSLLSQILMASTYPLEVVQADRWAKANAGLKDDALGVALEKETWDPSVKSLVNVAEVLTMMSDKLDWTTKLGDAFLAQQKQVMDAVQVLRKRAKDEGNLNSTEQQKVEVQVEGGTQYIVIESASPEVIYVPQYDPVVVYGAWPYPAYPPYYYYPPGYVAGTAMLSFGLGVACGAAWGNAWGDCDWDGGDVNIDIDRNANFNRNMDRTKIRNDMSKRGLGNGKGQWRHDASHRRGVSYRDNATAKQYGRGTDARATQAREQFRGRADAGRANLARGGGATPTTRPAGGGRSTGSVPAVTGSRTSRPTATSRTSGSRSSAFGGTNRSSSSTRAASSRGSASRASSPSRSAGGSLGGGGRGGGGRGGGGRR
jgi:hypothetical protein